MNEAVYVKADNEALYFDPLNMQSLSQDKQKLNAHESAELFWRIFIRLLQ